MFELKVEGMTCGHCAARITQAVKSVDPAAKVEIDLAGKKVRLESGCALADITDALAEAGYPAKPADAAQPGNRPCRLRGQ